ncbi:phage tail assembly chaperone [Pseudomonas mosselii]|uniref:phage tail assembly chaperone n=1 Tax=Pseudomonas mosselii TaxID=78327 RepID=UPI0021A86ACA|nr:phage tail assembly chaperone [Pseudomonas mosselii]UWS68427.1 phage tail assembly chaperone [Pseudomonas mosselii]
MKFSPSTELFYSTRIHSEIPVDAIEVSDSEYKNFLIGRNAGQRIVLDNGALVLASPDPELEMEQVKVRERSWRDAEVASAAWIRDRHRDEQELGIATTLSPEQFAELLGYIQQLRDWPQSESFPHIPQRPVAPPWLASLTP